MARKKNKMQWWDTLFIILLIIGGLNWGLVGFFDFNLVQFLFGSSIIAKITYGAVFVSSVYSALWLGFGKK